LRIALFVKLAIKTTDDNDIVLCKKKLHEMTGSSFTYKRLQGQHSNVGTVFFAVGFSVMMVLDVALG
jgi:hypothetical protein